MENIILLGAGGHAHSVVDTIEQGCKYNIVGFLDTEEMQGKYYRDYPVLDTDEAIKRYYITFFPINMPSPSTAFFETTAVLSIIFGTV